MTGKFGAITVSAALDLFVAFERDGPLAIVETVSGAGNGAITRTGVEECAPHAGGVIDVSGTILF